MLALTGPIYHIWETVATLSDTRCSTLWWCVLVLFQENQALCLSLHERFRVVRKPLLCLTIALPYQACRRRHRHFGVSNRAQRQDKAVRETIDLIVSQFSQLDAPCSSTRLLVFRRHQEFRTTRCGQEKGIYMRARTARECSCKCSITLATHEVHACQDTRHNGIRVSRTRQVRKRTSM